MKYLNNFKIFESDSEELNLEQDMRDICLDVTDIGAKLILEKDIFFNRDSFPFGMKAFHIVTSIGESISYFDIKDVLLRLKTYLGTRYHIMKFICQGGKTFDLNLDDDSFIEEDIKSVSIFYKTKTGDISRLKIRKVRTPGNSDLGAISNHLLGSPIDLSKDEKDSIYEILLNYLASDALGRYITEHEPISIYMDRRFGSNWYTTVSEISISKFIKNNENYYIIRFIRPVETYDLIRGFDNLLDFIREKINS